jgi:MFS family permease
MGVELRLAGGDALLFGAGEAGCFPNLTKTFTTWLPHHERVRAQGIMWLSARWGGAFTPPLVYLAIQVMSWRHAFELFGCIGVVWAIFFYAWYRDHPRDNPSLNAAERQLWRRTKRWHPATRMFPGGSSPLRRRSGCCADNTSALPTAGISTSRGCPLI